MFHSSKSVAKTMALFVSLACTADALAIASLVLRPRPVDPTLSPTATPLLYDPETQFCRSIEVGGGSGGGGGGDQFPLDAFLASVRGSLSATVLDSSGNPTQAPLGGFFARRTLNPTGAHGAGLPDGFPGWPSDSTPGQLSGMNWPYRDFMNFQSQGNIPGGNDASPRNGDITSTGIVNIDAAQNFNAFGPRSKAGLGLLGFENLFDCVFEDTSREARTIRFTFTIETAEVRLANSGGALFTNYDLVRTSSVDLFVPAPGACGVLVLAAAAAVRRRRV